MTDIIVNKNTGVTANTGSVKDDNPKVESLTKEPMKMDPKVSNTQDEKSQKE